MKSRKLGIALLVMLAFVVTTGTFAYWATSISGPSNGSTTGTVNIGTASEVTTSFTLNNTNASGGLLVPAGLAGDGEVESVTLTYTVAWNEATDATTNSTGGATTGTLTVTPVVTAVKAGGGAVSSSLLNSLIVVTANAGNASSLDLNATAESLSWVITMNEPANQAEYDEIQGAVITVTFTWSLVN